MQKVKQMFNWRLLLIVSSLLVVSVYFTMASGTKFFVNNTPISSANGTPFVKDGVTYVPLKASVHMGDKYYYISKSKTAYITKKSGEKINVPANSYLAKTGIKSYVAFTSKRVNGKYVHKALLVKNILYVPTEFVEKTLKYPVTIKKSGSTTMIYVGKVPASTSAPSTTGSDNREAVIDTLVNKYNYAKLSNTSASLNVFNYKDISFYQVQADLNNSKDMVFFIKAWKDSGVKNSDKIPTSIKNALDMMIPSGSQNIYNIIDTTAKSGKHSSLGKTFSYNGYKVTVSFNNEYITVSLKK